MDRAHVPEAGGSRVLPLRPRSERNGWWTRRRRDRGSTAFVLGGGGNLGAAQVGMLRALAEHGIRADLVVGCSVGALNAAAYAADPTADGVRRIETEWRAIRGDDIFRHGRVWGPWQLAMRREALHSPNGLEELIGRFLPYDRIEDAAVPLSIVATALDREDEWWFEEGPVVPALMASTALPGLLPPVRIGERLFVDGGVVNQVPLNRAVARGARRIYVLNCDRPHVEARRPIDMLINSFSISRASRLWRELAVLPEGVEAIVLPAPPCPPLRYADFSQSAALIDGAYESTARFLASTESTTDVATV